MTRGLRQLRLYDACREAGIIRSDRFYSASRNTGAPRELLRAAYRLQDGACAICGQLDAPTYPGSALRLVADHCHTCGGFRGWLCLSCNTAAVPLFDEPWRTRVYSAHHWHEPRRKKCLLSDKEWQAKTARYLRGQCPCWP